MQPSDLAPRARLAQLVVPRIDAWRGEEAWEEATALARDPGVGGFISFGGDVRRLREGLFALKALSGGSAGGGPAVPPLIFGDLERGCGQQVAGATAFPHGMALGAAGDRGEALAHRQGLVTAREAKALGIDVICAPLVDLQTNPENPIISIRAFGDEPQRVAALGKAFAAGVREGGGLAVAKHFPGHGEASLDSHSTLPVVAISAEILMERELLPFAALAWAGVPAIMTAHLAVPAVTGGRLVPATVAPEIVRGLLRKRLHYGGLVVSDALIMAGLTQVFATEAEAAVEALRAGVDVLLIPGDPLGLVRALEEALRSGALDLETVDKACARVLQAKRLAGLFRANGHGAAGERARAEVAAGAPACPEPDGLQAARAVAEAGLTCLENRGGAFPLPPGGSPVVVAVNDDPGAAPHADFVHACLGYAPRLRVFEVAPDSSDARRDAAAEAVARADRAVVALFHRISALKGRAGLEPGLAAWVRALHCAAGPLVAAIFGSPYLALACPGAAGLLCAYSDAAVSQRAAAAAVFGALGCRGRLPVPVLPRFPRGAGLDLEPLAHASPRGAAGGP